MNRFETFYKVAVFYNSAETSDDFSFGFIVHGQIRVIPVSEHTETLEILSLGIHLRHGVFAAFLSEFSGTDLLTRFSNQTFNFQFDRQTVTVPSRNIRSIKTGQSFGLDNNIL